jgi:hypothetical protein
MTVMANVWVPLINIARQGILSSEEYKKKLGTNIFQENSSHFIQKKKRNAKKKNVTLKGKEEKKKNIFVKNKKKNK